MYSNLKSLLSEHLNQTSLKELIDLSSQIALKFLNSKYQSDRNKFLSLGYSFADIAIDAITPLFIENQTTKEIGIIKSFKDWHTPIETEPQAQYFLNKIVVNRVEQELIQIYKEADPFFAKIHDSVEFIIEKEGYSKQTRFGTVYLCKGKFDEAVSLIPIDEFEKIPYSLFVTKLKTVVSNLFIYLTETQYCPAIPMNALVKRLKHIIFEERSFNRTSYIDNHEEIFDIQNLVAEALDSALDKLDTSYSRKLTLVESTAFKKALSAISADLTNGDISAELFEYLKDYIEDLSKDYFYEKYHSILDYLLRVLKKEIAVRLETENKFFFVK
ncbi:MAG: hypothetical protein WCZ90_02765 [Melioribacteraceae bacterium]